MEGGELRLLREIVSSSVSTTNGSFRILITGELSGLVETITDAVSVHSIKKSEYARRLASGVPIGHVSLMDHFVNVGSPTPPLTADIRQTRQRHLCPRTTKLYKITSRIQRHHLPPSNQRSP